MNIGTSGAPSYADIGTRLAPIASPNFSGTPKIGGVNIATSTDVNTATSGAVTTTSLTSTLASYVTTTALAAYAYVTTSALATTLALYTTTASLATTLNSYVTTASLTTTLNSYVTLTSLATTLGNYVTITALAGYSYVTASALATALSPYAPLASPSFTGSPTITPTGGTVSTVATQAWVSGQGYSTTSGVSAGADNNFTAKQTFTGGGNPLDGLGGSYRYSIGNMFSTLDNNAFQVNQGSDASILNNGNMFCAEFYNRILMRSELDWVSDQRSKTNMTKINPQTSLQIIDHLSPVNFNYIHSREYCTGFIAQDVKEVLPEAVTLNQDYIPNIYQMGKIMGVSETLPGTLSEILSETRSVYMHESHYKITFETPIVRIQEKNCKIKLINKRGEDVIVTLERQLNEFCIVITSNIPDLDLDEDQDQEDNVDQYGRNVRASPGSLGLLLDPPSSSMNGGLVVLPGNPEALCPGQTKFAEDTEASSVFVYGQQVKDFHHLSMNTIFVHAVSAIKQLHTELAALKTEVVALQPNF